MQRINVQRYKYPAVPSLINRYQQEYGELELLYQCSENLQWSLCQAGINKKANKQGTHPIVCGFVTSCSAFPLSVACVRVEEVSVNEVSGQEAAGETGDSDQLAEDCNVLHERDRLPQRFTQGKNLSRNKSAI